MDYEQWVGKKVTVSGEAYAADEDSVHLLIDPVSYLLTTEYMERELHRHLLKNCGGLSDDKPECMITVVVTVGEPDKELDWAMKELHDAKWVD